MKVCILILTLAVPTFLFRQQNKPGVFDYSADIGNPKLKGTTLYDEATQTYTLKGSGYNVWFNRDEFQYAYKMLIGDFILTANFELTGKGKDLHRKIGWMVRASTDKDAAAISAVAHGKTYSIAMAGQQRRTNA